jgi:ATP-dependent 26S proteasome regulatory subunit
MDRSFQPTNAILFELLNGTDGLDKDHDTLFVLTTNQAELLEPALAARPGRIDQAVELVSPDPGGRRRLLAPSCARPRAT